MTKDELEIEAEEYAKKNGSCFSKEYGIRYRTYMDCAEPREKRIAELEKEIEDLEIESTQLDNENLVTQARAKELIRKLYSHVFQGMDFMELNDFNVLKAEAENFLKENEVEK